MGFNNPHMPWKEFEQRLSDGRTRNATPAANGGDSPAWSRRRQPYEPAARPSPPADGVPYAELHCHSNFSFLDGASHPEELVEEAARLGLAALAVTDHDGMYGVVRFAEAAAAAGLPTVFGAEVTLGLTRGQAGVPDPEGTHLVVLARDPTGYGRLCKALSVAHLLGREKGRPLVDLPLLAAIGAGAELDLSTISMSDGPSAPVPTVSPPAGADCHWLVLTGCRKGTVPTALINSGPATARAELLRLQR